jgi:hypothetical protein
VRCQEVLGEMPRTREVAAFLLREQERAREEILVRCQEQAFGEMPRSGSLVRCQDQGILGEMPREGTFGEMPRSDLW